jgi:hypothetical protein
VSKYGLLDIGRAVTAGKASALPALRSFSMSGPASAPLGTPFYIAASFEPEESGDDRTLSWSSSNPGVATVSANTGLVTPISSGTASITASNGKLSSSFTVTVVPANYGGGGGGGGMGCDVWPGAAAVIALASLAIAARVKR